MHGLIFVTWEHYLAQRFGEKLLHTYRDTIGETAAQAPLASRLYSDETLLAGVGVASELTKLSAEVLLHEYGRYFIINGLTSHLCAQVLRPIRRGRDLLLTMSKVHGRLRRTNEGLTPPLFRYEASGDKNTVIVIYDSPRQVCPVLWGAIEGAAERYGEQVEVVELSCMKKGDDVCRFSARFTPIPAEDRPMVSPEQRQRYSEQQQLARMVLATLPLESASSGITLSELQERLEMQRRLRAMQLRPALLLEALQHLQFAGYVASTSNEPGDDLNNRRYARVMVIWDEGRIPVM